MSWRSSSTKRYDAIWSCFKDFLSRRRLGLDSVSVNTIIEYIAWLFQEGRQYKTIYVHRSVLSSMFPTMDGHSVGSHPTISRAMRGIFNERPPFEAHVRFVERLQSFRRSPFSLLA